MATLGQEPQPKPARSRGAARRSVGAVSDFVTGFRYSVQGFRLAFSPRLRRFTIAPVAINVLLYVAALWGLVVTTQWCLHAIVGEVDRWYDYLAAGTVGLVAAVLFGLLFFFTFVLAANVLAAPFADFLSERTEAVVTGRSIDQPFTVGRFIKDVWVGLVHAAKLLLCQCLVLLLGLVPVVGPVVAIVGTALLLALEYMDYAMTRRRMSFRQKRDMTFRSAAKSAGFGVGALMWMVVPVLNLACVPAAVCGATVLFLDLEQSAAAGNAGPAGRDQLPSGS